MENEFTNIESLVDHLHEFAEIKLSQAKLSVAAKTSSLISNLVAGLAIGMIFFFSIVFAAFALAYKAGDWFESRPLGFLVVAALYLVLGAAVWKFRERLFRIPIMNNIISQIFHHEQEDSKNQKAA